MDGSELAGLAAYKNSLVSAESDDAQAVQCLQTPTSENTTLDAKELKELCHVFLCVCCVWVTEACAHIKSDYFYS